MSKRELKQEIWTPWDDKSDFVSQIGRGVLSICTPGHGGIRVAKSVWKKFPVSCQPIYDWCHIDEKGYGWYEEDLEACRVMAALPNLFPDENWKDFWEHMKESMPEVYEEVYLARQKLIKIWTEP